jgi:2-methylfumaryl-CoA isomerase
VEGPLEGLRIVELSAFVAAPLGGATLASLGADVVRVDPLGGGVDAGRWPVHQGRSLYWAGLNRGKRSIALDLRSELGQEAVARLAGRFGTVITNLPSRGALSYQRLRERRRDLVMVEIEGRPDGRPAVDYTVNAATGFPFVTGPEGHEGPVNHVLPAWDVATGLLAAVGLLAADRRRLRRGQGGLVRLSLAEVAVAVASHLGLLDEARLLEEPRGRFGNHLFGTFARDFRTSDGRYVIVLALTPRQWSSLESATGLPFREIAADLRQEGERWLHREEICALLQPWIAARTEAEVAAVFEEHQVLWGPYRTFKELLAAEPLAAAVRTTPLRFGEEERPPAPEGPRLGADTEAVLRELGEDVEGLRAAGVIA